MARTTEIKKVVDSSQLMVEIPENQSSAEIRSVDLSSKIVTVKTKHPRRLRISMSGFSLIKGIF